MLLGSGERVTAERQGGELTDPSLGDQVESALTR